MLGEITPAQCRGARGILNWSQPDLAERAKIHVQTICNFEQEKGTPTKRTLNKLRQTFELEGLEFDNGGIRVTDSITRLRGAGGFEIFLKDVRSTVQLTGTRKKPCEVFVHNTVEDYFSQYNHPEAWELHKKKMIERKHLADFRILVKEGDYNFEASKYAQYRWYPKSLFYEQCFYSYGNKLAFLNFDSDEVKITIMNQENYAKTFRHLFRIAWNNVALTPKMSHL